MINGLPREWVFHPEHSLLACRKCQVAITEDNAIKHAQQPQHGMCRTAAEEEDLRNLVSGLKPAKIPELHRQLQAQQPVPAFEGLNTRDGYQCKLCNAARSSTESAQKHQQEHNQGQCMVPCLIQTLCKNGYVFVVRPPESDKTTPLRHKSALRGSFGQRRSSRYSARVNEKSDSSDKNHRTQPRSSDVQDDDASDEADESIPATQNSRKRRRTTQNTANGDNATNGKDVAAPTRFSAPTSAPSEPDTDHSSQSVSMMIDLREVRRLADTCHNHNYVLIPQACMGVPAPARTWRCIEEEATRLYRYAQLRRRLAEVEGEIEEIEESSTMM